MPESSTPAATDQQIVERLAVNEEWSPIFRYKGEYEISTAGRVRSYKRIGRTENKPKILKLNLRGSDGGYWYIQLRRDGRTFTHKVARLVAETFIPNPLGLPIVNHKNGIKTQDNVYNLEWCNQSFNLKHAYRTGLKIPVRGEESPNAKLSNTDVRTIRRMGKQQYTLREIAAAFNVSHTTIKKVLSFSKWKHVC